MPETDTGTLPVLSLVHPRLRLAAIKEASQYP